MARLTPKNTAAKIHSKVKTMTDLPKGRIEFDDPSFRPSNAPTFDDILRSVDEKILPPSVKISLASIARFEREKEAEGLIEQFQDLKAEIEAGNYAVAIEWCDAVIKRLRG